MTFYGPQPGLRACVVAKRLPLCAVRSVHCPLHPGTWGREPPARERRWMVVMLRVKVGTVLGPKSGIGCSGAGQGPRRLESQLRWLMDPRHFLPYTGNNQPLATGKLVEVTHYRWNRTLGDCPPQHDHPPSFPPLSPSPQVAFASQELLEPSDLHLTKSARVLAKGPGMHLAPLGRPLFPSVPPAFWSNKSFW